MDFSVIVPVYNEEKNLESCFGYLKSQQAKNFEIIFINDGSTDESEKIIKSLIEQNKDMDISLISQKNKGIAGARKTGILHAKYDYVTIFDCDDRLETDSLFNLAKDMETYKADIVLFDLFVEYFADDNSKKLVSPPCFTKEKIILGKDCFDHTIEKWEIHALGMYKKNIFLDAYKIYESFNPNKNYIAIDETVHRFCFYLADKVIRSSGKYIYQVNTCSTTKRINQDFYSILYNYIILNKFILENRDSQLLNSFTLINLELRNQLRYFRKNHKLFSNKLDWLKTFDIVFIFLLKKSFTHAKILIKYSMIKVYLIVKIQKYLNMYNS